MDEAERELAALRRGAAQAAALGLEVHAGHGLTYENVEPIAAIPELMELNIGHFLIGEAIFRASARDRGNAPPHGRCKRMTSMPRLTAAAALPFLLLPAMASAGSVAECGDYRTDIRSLAEPWEDNTRVFGNGEVRVALIDTIEPAAAAFHLVILHPPYGETGQSACSLIASAEGPGFSGIDFPGMTAIDAPPLLTLTVPVATYDSATDTFPEGVLTVTLDHHHRRGHGRDEVT